jgi:hypothetical protein
MPVADHPQEDISLDSVATFITGLTTIVAYAAMMATIFKLFQIASELGEIKELLKNTRVRPSSGESEPESLLPVIGADSDSYAEQLLKKVKAEESRGTARAESAAEILASAPLPAATSPASPQNSGQRLAGQDDRQFSPETRLSRRGLDPVEAPGKKSATVEEPLRSDPWTAPLSSPRSSETKHSDAKLGEMKLGETKAGAAELGHPKFDDSKFDDPKPSEATSTEAQLDDLHLGRTRGEATVDLRAAAILDDEPAALPEAHSVSQQLAALKDSVSFPRPAASEWDPAELATVSAMPVAAARTEKTTVAHPLSEPAPRITSAEPALAAPSPLHPGLLRPASPLTDSTVHPALHREGSGAHPVEARSTPGTTLRAPASRPESVARVSLPPPAASSAPSDPHELPAFQPESAQDDPFSGPLE